MYIILSGATDYKHYSNIITTRILLLSCVLLAAMVHVFAGTRECCRHIPNKDKYTPCKDACEQLWMSNGRLQQLELFSTAYRHCPMDNLVNFWQCIGTNYPVLTEIESWEGRSCCEIPYPSGCQLACQTANGISDLERKCSATEESPLYDCARRQTGSKECCSKAFSTQCKAACRAMFARETSMSDSILQENLGAVCVGLDSHVKQCIARRTERHHPSADITASSIQCCKKGGSNVCKQTCERAFTSMTNQADIIEALKPDCGPVSTTEPLWQCFLLSQADISRGRPAINRKLFPADGASLQCCSRAVSSQCRSLCVQLYDSKLTSVWESFSAACQYNKEEAAMMECIQEVKEPCNVGCKGLDFCTNYNNRVDTMFRSCNRKADTSARREYSSWLRNRYIQLPSALTVPIKDIRTCEASLWKAIACALNIQPCNAQSSSNKICKADCIHILSSCIDDSESSYNIGALCDQLPVSDDENLCISLHKFTYAVKTTPSIDLSNPCVPDSCNSTEVCVVNHNYPQCKTSHRHCQPFVCRSSCPVGENSPLRVHTNYHVKLLDVESSSSLTCQKICKCGHNGYLTSCQERYCDRADSCMVAPNYVVDHGAQFISQCNQCVCHSGEVICTNRYCLPSQPHRQNRIGTNFGLPCGCSSAYEPVCTSNGQVFGNPCLAQCAGHRNTNYTAGNCASSNPCGTGNCPEGSKCLSERKVCLSPSSQCPQYRCVAAECDSLEHDVVCDNTGKEHPNLCILLAKRKQLSYIGHCMSHCDHGRAVCGVNGETYMNECSALAHRVSVDYHTPCKTIANVYGEAAVERTSCTGVLCEDNLPEWCEGIIPPGACCPICGTQITSLYSKRQVGKIVAYSRVPYISTKDIAEHLSQFLTNKLCQVYVYISYEQSLVILILSRRKLPTKEEVNLCNIDGRKISNMIQTKSPIITTDIRLSSLLTSSLTSSNIIPVPSSLHSKGDKLNNNIVIYVIFSGIYYAIT